MVALNITKNSLINSQDGATTRNVDGEIYRIAYDAPTDQVLVQNRKVGQQYVAIITKDNRILIDLEEGTPLAVGMGSFEDWQRVFKVCCVAVRWERVNTTCIFSNCLVCLCANTHVFTNPSPV